jgi:hypothetical protein
MLNHRQNPKEILVDIENEPDTRVNSIYERERDLPHAIIPTMAWYETTPPWVPSPPQPPRGIHNPSYNCTNVQNYQTIPFPWVPPPPQPVPEPMIPIFERVPDVPNYQASARFDPLMAQSNLSDPLIPPPPQLVPESDNPRSMYCTSDFVSQVICPATPQVSGCLDCPQLLNRIELLEQRVMRLEHELEQIRNKELDREKAKCHKLGRSSCVQPDGPAAKYKISDDTAVIPEVIDSLTPAETFPNGMGPNEAISSISCNFVKSHPPATASHSFEKVIKPEPETIHPQQVLWEIPAVSNAQTPCKKREMPEKVPNDPEEDKSHPPASYWINPLGKKVPIPLPIKNQPTPKLDDNGLLVDNHFPITKADLCERRVIEPAPRTPEPESRPPRIWENPAFSNDDPSQTKEILEQEKKQNVPEERKSQPPASYCKNPIKCQPKPKLLAINNDNWWKTLSKWLPAKKMHLPDDTNPVIIWDQENGMWVDTSRHSPPPPPDKYHWGGAPLSMVFDEATGNWVDRRKEMCGVSLGPGHHHTNQLKLQKLLQELAAKKTGGPLYPDNTLIQV